MKFLYRIFPLFLFAVLTNFYLGIVYETNLLQLTELVLHWHNETFDDNQVFVLILFILFILVTAIFYVQVHVITRNILALFQGKKYPFIYTGNVSEEDSLFRGDSASEAIEISVKKFKVSPYFFTDIYKETLFFKDKFTDQFKVLTHRFSIGRVLISILFIMLSLPTFVGFVHLLWFFLTIFAPNVIASSGVKEIWLDSIDPIYQSTLHLHQSTLIFLIDSHSTVIQYFFHSIIIQYFYARMDAMDLRSFPLYFALFSIVLLIGGSFILFLIKNFLPKAWVSDEYKPKLVNNNFLNLPPSIRPNNVLVGYPIAILPFKNKIIFKFERGFSLPIYITCIHQIKDELLMINNIQLKKEMRVRITNQLTIELIEE